jgi:hypothetical protein
MNPSNKTNIGEKTLNAAKEFILIPLKNNSIEEKLNNRKRLINNNNDNNNQDKITIDYKKSTELFLKQFQKIEEILTKFSNLVKNLEYSSYSNSKNNINGVYRNLNIKFNNENILMNLMISASKITIIDLNIIIKALNFELGKFSNNLSIYLSFNEKVITDCKDSKNFLKIFGDKNKSLIKTRKNNNNYNDDKSLSNDFNNNKNDLLIYPFDSDEDLIYLKNFKLEEIFNLKKDKNSNLKFNYVFDLTSNYIPYCYLMDLDYQNFVFFKEENKFMIYDYTNFDNISNLNKKENTTNNIIFSGVNNINNDNNNKVISVPENDFKMFFSNNNIKKNSNEKEKEKDFLFCFDKYISNNKSDSINLNIDNVINNFKVLKKSDIENEVKNKLNLQKLDLENSLFILNLKGFDYKLSKTLKKCRFQIIISNSFLQILDFLKTFSSPEYLIKDVKIKFIKDCDKEIKDIILFMELDSDR